MVPALQNKITIYATHTEGAFFVNTSNGKVFIERGYAEANRLARELNSTKSVHSTMLTSTYEGARLQVLRWLFSHGFIENFEVGP